MTFPEIADVLGLYQRVLTLGAWEYFQQQSGPRVRRGLYSAPVVLWLMIRQRLQASGTLATAVQMLIQGGAGSLLPDCLRARQEKISPSTGGYAQARRRLPALLFRQVMRELTEKLRVLLEPESTEPRAYLLDGSSLELDHSPALAQQYPPAKNQHGTSHWPVLKLAVLHELQSGLAEEPHWGPMFGPRAVSEQALAQQALDRLPAGSVVVGDRNFGVLWVVAAAQQRQLCPLVRLTEVRAKKLMAGPIAQEGDFPIVWKASRWDGGKARQLPRDTQVTGRLIAVRIGRGKAKQWLYLFTTLDWSVERIVALYGKRWNIELDLRSLKRTVRLHHVAVKSNDMLEKELWMAICAYNLVRAVMTLAAHKTHRDPRQLSFAHVLNVVDSAWPKLLAAQPDAFAQQFDRILDLAARCRLPKRKSPRSFPRRLWHRQPGFPYRSSRPDPSTKTK